MKNTPKARAALDRCETISSCWKAIGSLMNPNSDAIGLSQRDSIATLCDFLNAELAIAQQNYLKLMNQQGG